MIETRWKRAILILLGWTFVGLFFTTQTFMAFGYGRRPIRWSQALALALTEYSIWAALTPVILFLARRFRFERRRWPVATLVHLPASALFAMVQAQIWFAIAAPLASASERPLSARDLAMAVGTFKPHMNVLTYWVVVGISHAFRYYRRMQERELKASQLETRLAQAQLQVLKMQLHPHFLFNTLHSISTLMHRDVEAADRMIAHLSDLLRVALESAGVQEVPLKRELEILDRYLAIEKVRFPDRLRVLSEIHAEVLDAQVPTLILQPLAENAVRYSVAPRASGGEITIRAARQAEALCIEIEDDGPGLAEEWQEGLGLSNTRARLKHLYGEGQSLTIGSGPRGGLLVRVRVPYHV